jgi:hypothetical protein|tara:strand:+ start:688 stop:846 length:159 start_codon:yes stop_codon:yes gene_type:complete
MVIIDALLFSDKKDPYVTFMQNSLTVLSEREGFGYIPVNKKFQAVIEKGESL